MKTKILPLSVYFPLKPQNLLRAWWKPGG